MTRAKVSPQTVADLRYLEQRRKQREHAEKIRRATVALNDAMLDAWNFDGLICEPVVVNRPPIDKPLVHVRLYARITDENGIVK